jgi:hypothetical protein
MVRLSGGWTFGINQYVSNLEFETDQTFLYLATFGLRVVAIVFMIAEAVGNILGRFETAFL